MGCVLGKYIYKPWENVPKKSLNWDACLHTARCTCEPVCTQIPTHWTSLPSLWLFHGIVAAATGQCLLLRAPEYLMPKWWHWTKWFINDGKMMRIYILWFEQFTEVVQPGLSVWTDKAKWYGKWFILSSFIKNGKSNWISNNHANC